MHELFLLKIVFQKSDFLFARHDAVRDALVAALRPAGVGEVTGRGNGLKHWSIKVEVTNLEQGLEVTRRTLQGFGCPASTAVRQQRPQLFVHRL